MSWPCRSSSFRSCLTVLGVCLSAYFDFILDRLFWRQPPYGYTWDDTSYIEKLAGLRQVHLSCSVGEMELTQRLWWSRVGEELSDFVHGGVLATFRLDLAKCPIARILGHNGKFNFTPAHDCEVRGVQDDFFTHRALEVGPVGLPESACLSNARTREVSRRTGLGAALEALGHRKGEG